MSFRVGHAGVHVAASTHTKRDNTCSADQLYTFPNSSSVVDASSTVTFTWDASCDVGASEIDLYIYEPSAATSLIQAFTNLTFSEGSYAATLQPKWWNDTTSAELYVTIVASGGDYWASSIPPGPQFEVTYPASKMYSTTTVDGVAQTSTAAAAASASGDSVFQSVSNTPNASHKVSKGAIAAAVVVPLLVLAGVGAVVVYFYRLKEKEKRKRWSHALSSHSALDWEKGANPGEKLGSMYGRPSTQFGRPSTQFGRPSAQFGRPSIDRPASSILANENMAGAGAGGPQRPPYATMRSHSASDVMQAEPTRSSIMLPDGGVRQSRISFAETARPDRRSRMSFGGELRPSIYGGVLGKGSRSATDLPSGRSAAYATGSALEDDDGINTSPSQTHGPNAFTDADMRRAAHGQRTGRRSMLSLGGGNRRGSTASALSQDDFRSAASARGSVDELRDMEAIMLMRRSVISQASGRSPNIGADHSPNPQFDDEYVEALDHDESHAAPTMPAPIAGSSTVAYGPDQMLAVYAARGKVSPAAAPASTLPSAPQPSTSGFRRLLGRKEVPALAPSPIPSISAPQPLAEDQAELRAYPGQHADALALPDATTGHRAHAGQSMVSNAASMGSVYAEDEENVGAAK
ncbi:hypothetical protein Q5752_004931 [Cryptotrichosporon argae]